VKTGSRFFVKYSQNLKVAIYYYTKYATTTRKHLLPLVKSRYIVLYFVTMLCIRRKTLIVVTWHSAIYIVNSYAM
jgi:hypothetical protein